MGSPNVLEMIRPFDPMGSDAEEQYDTVVRRLNRVRARRNQAARELAELERQFVEGDLTVRSGPRRGQTLSKSGRRRRLTRMLDLGAEVHQLDEVEAFSSAALDRMNRALDRWARETYGS
ncbi:MAG: hypothetical protein CMJ83_02370 [Planctomycetes bacterium]|jgi:hypothetical protein|nr:hypothetical protein [Planctomycetota bacterium]